MKKVTFKYVKIQNFLSVGSEPLEIHFQSGINLITGENKDKGGKNGVGKSSILEAIYWCLFGNTIREIKSDKIIHNLNDKGGIVTLNFDVKTIKGTTNYTITRSLKPSKLSLDANLQGENVDMTLSTIPETEKYIKELIGGTEEVFQNAVIMSANNTVPFMAQKKVDKRKFIEGIMNLNIFSEMLLKTRSEFNEVKKKNDILSSNFINLQRNLTTFEQQKANYDVKKQEKIDFINDKIKEIEKNSEELNNNNLPTVKECNDQLEKLEEKVNTLKTAIKSFNKTKSELITKSSNVSAEIKQLEKEKQKILDKGNTCPTCNREYCEDDIKQVKQRITDIDSEISKLAQDSFTINAEKMNWDDKIEELEEGVEKLNKKIRELDNTKSEIKLVTQKLSSNSTQITDFRKTIAELENGDPTIQSNIDRTQKDIEKTENELKDIKKQLSVLESVKFIVSEDGIKSYLFKKMLSVLNNRLNFYLKLLDAPCKCEFNELFEETIVNDTGKECSYHNFSGGEKMRLNIAVLLMFQDILRSQSGTSYNLNVYDELLDSAIDQKGSDKILEILRDRVEKYDESIYVISHNSSVYKNIDNVIFLEKENGSTRISS
jgi:DNA repair exonuclease SbcCD ATPase subunit